MKFPLFFAGCLSRRVLAGSALLLPAVLGAAAVSFEQPEIEVAQDAGEVVLRVVVDGAPPAVGIDDVRVRMVDGTATAGYNYGTFGSLENLEFKNYDFAEGMSVLEIPVSIRLMRWRGSTDFSAELEGINGNVTGANAMVKITIAKWLPPRQILRDIDRLERKIDKVERSKLPPARKKKLVRRLDERKQRLEDSIRPYSEQLAPRRSIPTVPRPEAETMEPLDGGAEGDFDQARVNPVDVQWELAPALLSRRAMPAKRISQPDQTQSDAQGVRATELVTVTDDFIVDIYRNGRKIDDTSRTLVNEVFGATVERIRIPVVAGDWIVFHVVNNRMRWGGAYYFAVAGMRDGKSTDFVSSLSSGNWSHCDNPGEAARFIAERTHGTGDLAREINRIWADGDGLMRGEAGPDWKGDPVWGGSRNTWIKVLVR